MKLLLAATTTWVASVPAVVILAVAGGPDAAAGVPVAASVPAASAIRASVSLVGARSGWYRACDRLACRAYGHAVSGYASAAAHWQAMLAGGHAHPGDRCPPPGTFMFWATPSGEGHVALVAADPACDPDRIVLVSNDVGDAEQHTVGGVYAVTLTRLETGFVSRVNYLGWSDPICAGALLDPRSTP